jgi:acyl-CoA synthetase (AMP-forming)/AMP-acid ligase II/1-acyl-sn-glycerol-3-phosphate acyltransferase/acyl carrier protein
MMDTLLRWFAKSCLALRYRVRTEGLDAVAAAGTRGILFLPNHPALIDPIIVGTVLHKTFGARFLADRDQVDRFFIRRVARQARAIPIPDPAKLGSAARAEVEKGLALCAEALRAGDNLVIYPAGHLAHGRTEDLRGNSAVRWLLDQVPAAHVVLVRTRGLWGSRFSYAYGKVPNASAVMRRAAGSLAASGVLFAPKRQVTIEFLEPPDFPRSADREALNGYLEAFYNDGVPPATFVPYTIWDRGGVRPLPEPDFGRGAGDLSVVPEATRRIVLDHLRQQTGVSAIHDEDHLARDLGLDSLARADILAWLSGEFGYPPTDVEALDTVGDVLLAACGESVSARVAELAPIPAKWFTPRPVAAGASEVGGAAPPTVPGQPVVPPGRNIAEVFLAQARLGPGRVITADQRSGVRTYRDMVLSAMVLRPLLAALPGQNLGILLPAGVAADVAYVATLLAGKTPVMVNWTVGPRNLAHCLELVGVQRVLTARALVQRLESLGTDLSHAAGRLVMLEEIVAGVSRKAKLAAAVRSRLWWRGLDAAAGAIRPEDAAVILFTSGSEALPKAVPLSHANILANLRDILALHVVRTDDRLLGFLPPFHSFGLTVTTVLPLCAGVAVAHHPDPTDAAVLARLIEAYRTTILAGTPTFLAAIARAGMAEQLAPLRLAVTGAEKCPERTYELLQQVNGQMEILEGYGVTECSPIVSVTRPGMARHGTIGLPLASVETAIVDAATCSHPVGRGEQGMLLVRGPSIFGGYLHYDGPSPFVEYGGQSWYRTGDLVSERNDGVLTFHGRLKRFVKLGGEMISLPAIEAVLEGCWPAGETEKGPVLAVEVTPDQDHPEIVLFTTRELDRQTVNARLREAGLGGLHNIRRVVKLDAIPVLGSGKTDYRALKEMLRDG